MFLSFEGRVYISVVGLLRLSTSLIIDCHVKFVMSC